MADEDVAREYERLRAELMEFVLDAVAQRAASGAQPELSAALVEAIDRRVDEAVSARLADAEFPDPQDFADAVIAAARRSEGAAPNKASAGSSRRAAPPPAAPGGRFGFWLLAAVAAIAVAAATYFFLSRSTPQTNTIEMTIGNRGEPVIVDPAQVNASNGAATTNGSAPAALGPSAAPEAPITRAAPGN